MSPSCPVLVFLEVWVGLGLGGLGLESCPDRFVGQQTVLKGLLKAQWQDDSVAQLTASMYDIAAAAVFSLLGKTWASA